MGFVHELHKIAIAKFAVNQTFQNFSKLKLLQDKTLPLSRILIECIKNPKVQKWVKPNSGEYTFDQLPFYYPKEMCRSYCNCMYCSGILDSNINFYAIIRN